MPRAVDPLRREHAVGAQLANYRGGGDGAEAAPLHGFREGRRVGGLVPVVGLRHKAATPLVDELPKQKVRVGVAWLGLGLGLGLEG